MKTMIKMLVLASVALLGLQSCEKSDEIISSNALPSVAQAFVAAHFPEASVMQVTKDYDDRTHSYKVMLSDGTYLEFNKGGKWREVENYATGVPEAILPATMLGYLQANFPDNFVVAIELGRVYDVELNSGLELDFSTSGEFLRIDM